MRDAIVLSALCPPSLEMDAIDARRRKEKASQACQTSWSQPPPSPMQSESGLYYDERPTLEGGEGGAGGKADYGGEGGVGQGTLLNLTDAAAFKAVKGGIGGVGGEGITKGGTGGLGEATKLNHMIIMLGSKNRTVVLPPLSIADFCKKYRLSPAIQKILEEEEYALASSLLELSDEDLKDLKFKRGQIAEVKRALREYLAGQNVETVL
ncbi:hypothetical protein HMN09_01262500 [Mycena chlorophos]|uniref:SAM domain-containing protein n=1 Tax=Mycena chlorophos TaxID=658473 RepID=A0A8H6S2H7_MYCCL|nr:hypothetical protein HMN09_01262500 [Mycena chlorophos]